MLALLLIVAANPLTFVGCPAESEVRRFIEIEAGSDYGPAGTATLFACTGDAATISATAARAEVVSHSLHLDSIRTSARPRILALAAVELWRSLRETEAERAPAAEPLPIEPPPPTVTQAERVPYRVVTLSASLGHDAYNIYADELSGLDLGYRATIDEGLELIARAHVSLLLSTFTPVDVGARYRVRAFGRTALHVEVMASATLHTELATQRENFWTADGHTLVGMSYRATEQITLSSDLLISGRYFPFLSIPYGLISRVIVVPGIRLGMSYFWTRHMGLRIEGALEAYLFYFPPQRDPTGEYQIANSKIPRFNFNAGPEWRW